MPQTINNLTAIVYNNLTQIDIHNNFHNHRFVYIRSTDIEQMHWERLLWTIPDELLFYLSQGYKVIIKDHSNNKRGSKVIRIFLPVFKDILNYIQHNIKDPKSKNLREHFSAAKATVDSNKLLKTKFKRFKIPTEAIYNNLTGVSIIVSREENRF